jgi:thiosulfate/3-mercaptopyruvate sulfurtransferase
MAPTPPPIIAPHELADLLSASRPPVLLDVRWQLTTGADREAYLDGHLPGAAFIDLDAELSDPPGPTVGRHPLPKAERFEAAMRAAGVSDDSRVVVYDDAASMVAARAWWLLRYFGHADTRVLDGGLAGWRAAGRALETEVLKPTPETFTPRPNGMPAVDADGAAALAAHGVLIDARAAERFLGSDEPVDPVAGHIPGARNRPTTENVDADGRFLTPEALADAFAGLGVSVDTTVAAYCGSGVNAAHEVLALELAGYRAALYPGSWSEWIGDPARPVAGMRPTPE